MQNTFPDYEKLNQLLHQQAVALTPAEMHGLISGMLCGGGDEGARWQTLVHELTNEGLAFSQTLADPLRELHEATAASLEDQGFLFRLLLPDDENSTVFSRVDALAGWVNHFLLGLGVVQPQLGKTKGELREAIEDLRNIGQLGYDEDEDQEELAQSLEEVIEYVRMAAMLCHTEFNHQPPAGQDETPKPILH